MNTIIGSKAIEKLPDILFKNNIKEIFLITDENVAELYLNKVLNTLSEFEVKTYILKPGEKSKSITTILKIYDELIKNNFQRNGIIISVGGGVVGDISGFVASTYMRGIDYIQVPTTLLAQVDSSIGGKVGVDYKNLKNIIGSFYFPTKTIIDIDFLKTLNKREIVSGLGEVLKYGLIEDYEFFSYVNENLESVFEKDPKILTNIVEKSVNIKNKIVKLDKKDKNIRKKLNFGHTIGHGIEGFFNFNKYNHGEAVILGILYESYISREIDNIDCNYFNQIYNNLSKLVRPIAFKENEIEKIINIMSHDKKNINNKIGFVLPVGKGEVYVFHNIEEKIIKKALKGRWI